MQTIREYYTAKYPTDELGLEINPNATFLGLAQNLEDTYEYIGVTDSIIRERLFEALAEKLSVSYQEIYEAWVESKYIVKIK